MTGFRVRPAVSEDAGFVVAMLVEAVNWEPGRELSRDQIMATPSLAHYVSGWMRADDVGVLAVETVETVDDEAERPIGAAWLRYLPATDPGYGYIGDDVPELSAGVVKTWRGRGVGRALVRAVLDAARGLGVGAVSLSVERANFAAELYAGEGFRVVESFADSDTMVAVIGA